MSVANQRDEHRAPDEDQEEHEDGKGQRTKKGVGCPNVLRVELQEKHFEDHFRGPQKISARADLRGEEQEEKSNECKDQQGEHQSEAREIRRCMGQRSIEQRQSNIQSGQTEKFQSAEVTAQTQEIGEQLIGSGDRFQIDELKSIALSKDISHARHLSISPNSNGHTRPRTSDD